ncbi:CDK5 and ABL1 enzyme substrate 2 isoform X2 [Gadus chalcogrammus]|uniref:CDK5 and ABL1 enzyme substrate 2 isoform X2 n=1 Tax=Gadus chalcogrammus TaxID=1042646 RepID=UPI0024C45E34|nr:CDK5 and ABL1 enzyme substrate 2 isoform X2 [Gadus chalcogrammus]
MATAACGLQSTGNTTTKSHKERQKKAKDSGRRQAALLFLSNISLDGRPVCHITNGSIEQKDVADLHVRDVGAPAGPPPEGNQEYVVKVSPTAPAAGPAIGALSPGRPSLVMSPGLAASVAVANEVFLEGGSEDTMPLFLEAPLSPITPGHPSSARSPSVFSPVQGVSATHLDSRQRTRNVSGSPGPKAPKKVHFIRSMRQYDTRGSSDTKLEVQRQRLSSVVAADLIPSLEGMELGAYGKTVSYAQFLYPTNALVRPRSSGLPESFAAAPTPQSRFRGNGQRNLTAPARLNSSVAQEPCTEEMLEYDPSWLSDPQWPCGRHKRVLIFASYVTTVIEYVKPSDLKKDMNETFKEKFPHIKLTLSKIRSLKREIRAMGEEGSLQPVTIAMAFVYFEKLVLQGRLNKHNRKLVSAACVLLAAKISSDLRKPEVRQLLEKLEERFRINRRELIPLEFQVLVALEMGLYLPESKVMPHYRRLVKQG